jgi:hypothetical protein
VDLLVIFFPQLHVQLLIQILEEDYWYEQLYNGLKMEGALKGIAILLPEASFIASSK